MSTLVPEWLHQRAFLTPERLGFIAGEESSTFAELDRRAGETAARLRDAGVGPGDHVALLAANGLRFAQVVFALIRVRAVLVPLNARLTAPELEWQVGDCEARFLIADATHAPPAEALAGSFPSLRRLELEALTDGAPSATTVEAERIDLDALHSIIYTSGTTGRPKGAMLTYGNHLWGAMGSVVNLGLSANDRWLAAMPLYHVGGLSILLRSVLYGTSAVIHEGFDAERCNQALDNDGITIISAVSTMLRRMLAARGETPYPKTLRCILLGGGPVSRELVDECLRRDLPVAQTYGLSESASQASTLRPDETPLKPGSAGKPLLPLEFRIEAPDGTSAAPGEGGEIVIRGPTVMQGYFKRPEETAKALRGGWLHTGDFGYLDDDGYLYVLDRRDDIIVTGGENVYPAEVEGVLESHPGVREAGVFGMSDPEWGQVVVAAVCLRDTGLDAAALQLFCRERIAGYKVPKRIHFVAELPRNAAGKLVRHVLRSGLQDWER